MRRLLYLTVSLVLIITHVQAQENLSPQTITTENVSELKLIATYPGIAHYPAFTADGRFLVTERPFAVWDLSDGSRAVLPDTIGNIVVHPTENVLALGVDDSTIIIWDLNLSEARATIVAEQPLLNQWLFSADGTELAGFNDAARLYRVYNGATGEELETSEGTRADYLSHDVMASPVPGWSATLTPIPGLQEILPLEITRQHLQFSLDQTRAVGTLYFDFSQGMTLVYALPGSPQYSVFVPGETKTQINLRNAPMGDAEQIAVIEGAFLASGRNGDYIYLADCGGWVRSGSDYVSLPIPLAMLPEISLEQVAGLPSPTPHTPVYTVATPMVTPTPVSIANDAIAMTPIPVIATLAPGIRPITATSMTDVRLLQVLPGRAVCFDDAGQRVLTLTGGTYTRNENTLTEWNLVDNVVTQTIVPGNTVGPFSPDCGWLLFGQTSWNTTDQDMHLSLWNTRTNQAEVLYHGSPTDQYRRDFSPDSSLIIQNFSVPVLYQTQSHSHLANLQDHAGSIDALSLSPDGRYVAATGRTSGTSIWELNGEAASLVTSFATGGAVLRFSQDGTLLAILNREAEIIYVASIPTGEMAYVLDIETSPGYDLRGWLEFSPNGEFLFAQTGNFNSGQMYVWRLNESEQPIIMTRMLQLPALSPDARLLATVDDLAKQLIVWDVQTGEAVRTVPVNTIYYRKESLSSFSPDGTVLAYGTQLELLRLLDIQSGESIAIPPGYLTLISPTFFDEPSSESPIHFSPDGMLLAVESQSSTMIFGVPSETRPAWESIPARVVPSAINLRAEPSEDSPIIATVSGEVRLDGRNANFVHVVEPAGWAWDDESYIDLGDYDSNVLPLLTSSSTTSE